MPTRVAAIQLPFTYFNTPQEFADYVRVPIELAAENGAQLILLPHLTSTMLFGMFDSDVSADQTLDDLAQRQKVTVRDWLNQRAGYVFEFYLHLFQSLASRVEVWLAPGTVYEQENDAFYLTALLFNPEGETVGRQRQMHPTAMDIQHGVSPGDTHRVFETELGDFGFVIGEDVRYPDVARALTLNGADALLHPAATLNAAFENPPSTKPQAPFLTDLGRNVQANQTFGVQANLVGGDFRGRSAIFAPAEMTPDQRGILAQASTDSSGEVVITALDFETLLQTRSDHPLLDNQNRH